MKIDFLKISYLLILILFYRPAAQAASGVFEKDVYIENKLVLRPVYTWVGKEALSEEEQYVVDYVKKKEDEEGMKILNFMEFSIELEGEVIGKIELIFDEDDISLPGYVQIEYSIQEKFRNKGWGTLANKLLHQWVDNNLTKPFLIFKWAKHDLDPKELEAYFGATENYTLIDFSGVWASILRSNIPSFRVQEKSGSSIYAAASGRSFVSTYPALKEIPEGLKLVT
jgi:hypothetical protein